MIEAVGHWGAGDIHAVLQSCGAITERAEKSNTFDHTVCAEVALSTTRRICAHQKGDRAKAIHHLGAGLPRMAECGGSHAQWDLFEQIYLDALIQDGRISAAQQVLEMRRIYDPDSVPLNRMLEDVYTQSQLPELATEARQREGAPASDAQ